MKKIIILILFILFFSTPALAKDGFSYGYGLVLNTIISDDLTPLEPGFGWELLLAYDFGSLAVEGTLLRTYHQAEPGFADGDMTGYAMEVHVPLFSKQAKNKKSSSHERSAAYLIGGYGLYDLKLNNGNKLEGGGFNIGIGFDIYFNERVAQFVRISYRIIDYDELNGSSASPEIDGDTFTMEVGLKF